MKKFLLTLIVTMLTCIGAWADGVVTLAPAPSGTLELNLTDDAGGKVFVLSSPILDSQSGNAQVSVIFLDDDDSEESSSDYVSTSYNYAWGASDPAKLTIVPTTVTPAPVKLKVRVHNQYEPYGDDYSEIITVSVNNQQKIPATLSIPAVRMGNVGKSASVTASNGLEAGTDYTVEYSADPTSVLEIDPSTGVITPKSEGTATITAVVTPIGTAADTYVTKTLTADVQVRSDLHATFSISPSANSILDVSNTTGEERTLNATDIAGFGYNFDVKITGDQVIELVRDNTKLTVKPKAGAGLGTATVTVKVTWYEYTTPENKDDAEASFQVTVDDKTLVKSFTVPVDQEIQKDKKTLFPILFTPFDAEFQTPEISTTGNISVAYAVKDKEHESDPNIPDYNILIVDATNAALGETATITIKPKTGSPAEAQSFTVTVGKPELPVTDVKPQTTYTVGDLVNTGLEIPADVVPAEQYTVEYTSSNTGVITVDNFGGIDAKHVGTAKITVRFTPVGGTEADANYKEWYREMDVVVKPAKQNITFTVTPNEFTAGSSEIQSGDINFSGSNFDPSKIVLTVEGTEDAYIGDDDKLYVKANAKVQTFVVKLTQAAPSADYEPFETTAQILVKGNADAGVILTTHYVKDANGDDTDEVDYVEVNVPTPGAFGTPLVDEPTYTSSDETSLADLMSAPKVKVTGLLANSDVQELVHLIGGELTNTDKNTSVCTSLDMGEAKMTEAITTTASNRCSLVPSNNKYMGSVKELVLPQPATGVANGTVLPAYFNTFFGNFDNHSANALESLTIPEGWTEIADYFGTYDGTGAQTFGKLTTLKLANSIEKIGAFAFSGFCVKVLDMPYNIKRINKNAFNNCPKLQDVYFFGPAPEFVHTNAFAGQTQFCNNTVDDNALAGVVDPTITRFEYYNGDGDNRVLACLLHYPKKYEADYIDGTRKYDVIPSDMPYSKGANIFTPTYWTPTFISDVKAALKARAPEDVPNLSHDDADPNIYIGSVLDYGVKDAYYGYSMIWPSQSQMTTGFGIAQAGYRWNGTPLDPINQYDPTSTYYKDGSIDKRGLYQFIVALNNADIDFKFEQDQWYTISLPYDLTADQVKEVFGANTQVCRFSSVTREIDGDDKTLILEFRNSTMGDHTDKYDGTSYVADGMEPAGKYTGIRHHYAYMIKPSGTITNEYIVQEGGKWHFKGTGFIGITGTIQPDRISEGGVEYIFAPNLSETAIKKNSYILMERKDKPYTLNGKTAYRHEYVFYKGVAKFGGASYVDGGKANQNTAYVQFTPEDGEKEFNDFFKDVTPILLNGGSSHAAPINASLFGFEDDGETTQIEKVVIVCGTDRVPDNKVYTINGQLVNSSVLAPGLYIKNGKKFIVK